MIGERLKILREKGGILQRELANTLKLTQQTISLYESGQREPDTEILGKIADYFGVTIDYLLGRTDNPNPHPQNSNIKDQPIAFAANGDINIEELEKIINRAVKKALREREKYGDNN